VPGRKHRGYQQLSDDVLHLLKVVNASEEIAGNVQIVNITIYQHLFDDIVKELIACLNACRNLTTLQLVGAFYGYKEVPAFKETFAGAVQFPNIRTASLDVKSLPIIKSLPNLETLHYYSASKRDREDVAEDLAAVPQIKAFYGLSPSMIVDFAESGADIAKMLPNVETLQLDFRKEYWHLYQDGVVIPSEVFPPLNGLDKLHTLRIRLPRLKAPTLVRTLDHDQRVAYLDYARGWLARKKLPTGVGRRIIVVEEGVSEELESL